MTSRKERLATDLKETMKARETLKISVLRMVKVVTKNRETERVCHAFSWTSVVSK